MKNNLQKWTRASNYGGVDWAGWLVAPCTRNRDSNTLDESNFIVLEKRLDAIVAECGDQDFIDDRYTIVRENHWACGWVEWIAIRPIEGCEISSALVACADKARLQMEDYPVLDEEHYSDLEYVNGETE